MEKLNFTMWNYEDRWVLWKGKLLLCGGTKKSGRYLAYLPQCPLVLSGFRKYTSVLRLSSLVLRPYEIRRREKVSLGREGAARRRKYTSVRKCKFHNVKLRNGWQNIRSRNREKGKPLAFSFRLLLRKIHLPPGWRQGCEKQWIPVGEECGYTRKNVK